MTAHVPTSSRFPSRLRLRFSQLRAAPMACAQLAASVRRIPGTTSVDVSAVTGSLLVIYRVGIDAEQTFLARLGDAFASHGLSNDIANSVRQDVRAPAPSSSSFDGVTEKLIGAVVDKLVERSALALLAALL